MTAPLDEKAKNIGIISYLTLIGWVVALVMHQNHKSSFGAFHIRQMLGVMITGVALSLVVQVIGFVTGSIFLAWSVNILAIIIWLLGFLGAIQGEEREIPIIGSYFQDWFKSLA